MKSEKKAILTGDIVGSRNVEAKVWLKALKSILNKKGKSPINWEIFRGDMFQLETEVEDSLRTALEIKARIKQIQNLDIRISIGIGRQEFKTKRISESNGDAYTNSGICFENLKKRLLAIKTSNENFDKDWNLNLRLISLVINTWTPTTSKVINEAIQNSSLSQTALSKKLKISQSAVSQSLKRGGYEEIRMLLDHFNERISLITKPK